jgi:hypothetical protein
MLSETGGKSRILKAILRHQSNSHVTVHEVYNFTLFPLSGLLLNLTKNHVAMGC